MARDEPVTVAQSALILQLARRVGLGTEQLDSEWTRVGLEREDCKGPVGDFVTNLGKERAGELIEKLHTEQQSERTQNWLQGTPGWFVEDLHRASTALNSVPAREHFADLVARSDVPSWFVHSQCEAIEKLHGGAVEAQQPEDTSRRQRAVYRSVEMGAALAEATPERIQAWQQERGFSGDAQGKGTNPRIVAAAYAADCVAERLHQRAVERQSLPHTPPQLLQLVEELEAQMGEHPSPAAVKTGATTPDRGETESSGPSETRRPETDTEWER